jgi:hypothetical protein
VAAFQNAATFWIAMQSGSSLKRPDGSQQDIGVDENRHYQRSGFKLARLTASSESGGVEGEVQRHI